MPTSILFSLALFINAVYAVTALMTSSILPTFILSPLTDQDGVFYSINMRYLSFWQKLSLANPIVYMVTAFSYGLT